MPDQYALAAVAIGMMVVMVVLMFEGSPFQEPGLQGAFLTRCARIASFADIKRFIFVLLASPTPSHLSLSTYGQLPLASPAEYN